MYKTMLRMGHTWVTVDVDNQAWNGSHLVYRGCIKPCLEWVTPGLPKMYLIMLGLGHNWVTEGVYNHAWAGSHLGY